MSADDLVEEARRWAASDPDPETRRATRQMLERGDPAELADHFGARLAFGTAGLRGALGPGPNRMNRALVRRVTAGIADWLLARTPRPRVVVGRDARVGSDVFAADAAAVLADRGVDVLAFADVVPTPELAHAVTFLGCDLGIMVTASHNPPGDNGYKVYAANGAQIVPPIDREIAEAIDRVEVTPDARGAARPVPAEARAAYLDGVQALRVHHAAGARVVYTAMHGVGAERVLEVLRRAGHHDVHPVAAQCAPDGAFPTVAFPNPEEPGALDLALALAHEVGADVILANDPDADRLAVAVPDGAGGWRQLTGNQVGCLLAEDLLTHGPRGGRRLVATTIVSTAMLARIAAAHEAGYAETLTGFKWIANGAAIPHVESGGVFVLGFEEALGYCVGSLVRDKDGVSAALLLADLASWAKQRGETLLDRLHALHRRYGVYQTAQHSLRLPPGPEGARRRTSIMSDLRHAPPTSLAGVAVVAIRDLAKGTSRHVPTGRITALTLPRSDVLAFELADGSRVLCRPSGTEPKVKFYLEVCEPMDADEPPASAEGRATVRIAALKAAVLDRVEQIALDAHPTP